MSDILNKKPHNDTGTDTLQRYRYQAQIALSFCLFCTTKKGEELRSVVMEHWEHLNLALDTFRGQEKPVTVQISADCQY